MTGKLLKYYETKRKQMDKCKRASGKTSLDSTALYTETLSRESTESAEIEPPIQRSTLLYNILQIDILQIE